MWAWNSDWVVGTGNSGLKVVSTGGGEGVDGVRIARFSK